MDMRGNSETMLRSWIERSGQGDTEAFAHLYDATAPWLLARVRDLRAGDAEEDVLAGAYLRAWHHSADFGAASRGPLPWLESFVTPGTEPRTAAGSGAGAARHAKPQDNRLLATLSPHDLQRWLPRLERVELELGQILHEAGGTMAHAYFPTTCIVSLLHVLANGATAEIAVAGREGFVGVSLVMGGGSTSSRAVVQNAGLAYRLPFAALMEEFNQAGAAMRLLLRYAQALATQMAQTAVCNRHHSLEQQLCRWLLLSLDRIEGNELVMTRELIANMLGVRRGGVTEAATKLQRGGVIRHARGRIVVLDRAEVERCACECYGVVRKEYDRLLSQGEPA